MVAVVAAATATCSLATAQAAIRATKPRVPSLATPDEPPVPADPALADRVACFSGVLAVSLASGGTAGDTAWLAFARTGSRWRVLRVGGGYKLLVVARGAKLEVVQPVYRAHDPNCCPTGGFDRVLYRYDGRHLVAARRWHTRRFAPP